MSTTVNPTLEAIEQALKSTVWDTALELALTALFVKAPYLAVWPFRPIIRGLARLFSDKMFDKLKEIVDVRAIIIMNANHRAVYDKAMKTLKQIAITDGIESESFKKAREHARIEFNRYVRFNG
jgi:hypothetical protein